ncbi:NADH:ubiquinone oxidoreductase complex I intermediate-associated protein 30 [Ramicandelaber brevisporus]|nr:NADH:ubiquinone oxidoreductase complex I intermediate-associated protein 30 [Ramicandelaber brevisporus]
MSLIDFTRPGELEKLVVGSDADMDGSSAAALELLVEDHGKITEYVPPEQPKEAKKLQQQQQQQTGKGGLNPSSRPYNPFTARALDLPDDEITFNDDISTISGRMAGKDDVDQDKLWMWCDQDAIDGDPSSPSFTFARFYGRISTAVPEKRHFVRSGYAGFRNRKRTSTLFGSVEWDCSLYRYLALRVRSPPLPAMSAASPTNGAAQDFKPQTDEQILTADKPRSFVVNVIPAGLEGQDLFQHRLYLHRPGQWETVLIPLNDFASVSSGALVSNQQQLYRERVHTVGISLADGVDGPFALDVRWIKCVNTAYTNGNSEHFGGIPHRSKKH